MTTTPVDIIERSRQSVFQIVAIAVIEGGLALQGGTVFVACGSLMAAIFLFFLKLLPA